MGYDEPTHLLEDSSLCIELIFKLQPNLEFKSSINLSLHSNCRHQIVFAKLNLMVSYPQTYSAIIGKLILTLSEEPLVTSIEGKPSLTLMLPKNYLFSIKQS